MKKQTSLWQKLDSYVLQHPIADAIITFIDATILRPIPVAWAASVALIGYSALQIIARQSGFQISGSELWVLCIAGWLLGSSIELVITLAKRLNK